MAHYSDPTHALLAQIAKGIDRLTETIDAKSRSDAKHLAELSADNVQLKEENEKLHKIIGVRILKK